MRDDVFLQGGEMLQRLVCKLQIDGFHVGIQGVGQRGVYRVATVEICRNRGWRLLFLLLLINNQLEITRPAHAIILDPIDHIETIGLQPQPYCQEKTEGCFEDRYFIGY